MVLVLADDAGIDLGIYSNPDIDSPNIDALGQQGMVFTHAYTSVSSCSPSRAALLTGLPSHQNGMYGLQHTIHHYKSFHNNVKSQIYYWIMLLHSNCWYIIYHHHKYLNLITPKQNMMDMISNKLEEILLL